MSKPKIHSSAVLDLSTAWKIYASELYPGGMEPEQETQLHQAFYGGALGYMGMVDAAILTAKCENAAMSSLQKIRDGVIAGCESIAVRAEKEIASKN